MESRPVKAFIVEEDTRRIRRIQEVLPEYINSQVVSFDEARTTIESRKDMTTIVIMNADDPEDRALALFDVLSNNYGKNYGYIPVVLTTADEFSERSFRFMDIGSPFFHEGEINDSDFYNKVIEAIESADDYEYDQLYGIDETSGGFSEFTEPQTSPDKLMGMVYDVESVENEVPRIAEFRDEEMMEMILSLTDHNKDKAIELWETLEEAVRNNIDEGYHIHPHDGSEPRRVSHVTHNEKKPKEKIFGHYNTNNHVASNNKASEEGSAELNALLSDFEHYVKEHADNKSQQPRHVQPSQPIIKMSNAPMQNTQMQNMPMQNMQVQNNGQMNQQMNQQMAMQNNSSQYIPSSGSGLLKYSAISQNQQPDTTQKVQKQKRHILIVDPDPMTLKACELFISDSYIISHVDSGMKAVDFFIKNSADIVMVENDLPFLPGPNIIRSIKMQPYGKYVKGIVLADAKKTQGERDRIASLPEVSGVVEKPILKKTLVKVLNACYA